MSNPAAAPPPAHRLSNASSRIDPASLRSLLTRHGGFTIDVHRERLVREGIAVGADPSATLAFDFERWCDIAVGRWIDRHREGRSTTGFLGGWVDRRGRCWLDPVRVFRSERTASAIELGRALDQCAVFDLGRDTLIPIGPAHLGSAGATAAAVRVPAAIGTS